MSPEVFNSWATIGTPSGDVLAPSMYGENLVAISIARVICSEYYRLLKKCPNATSTDNSFTILQVHKLQNILDSRRGHDVRCFFYIPPIISEQVS